MKFLNRLNGFIDNGIRENLKKHDIIDSLSSNLNKQKRRRNEFLPKPTDFQRMSLFPHTTTYLNGGRRGLMQNAARTF